MSSQMKLLYTCLAFAFCIDDVTVLLPISAQCTCEITNQWSRSVEQVLSYPTIFGIYPRFRGESWALCLKSIVLGLLEQVH